MERQDIANVVITYMGETKSLMKWCEDLNLNYVTVRVRYSRGTRVPELFRETTTTNEKSSPKYLEKALRPEVYKELLEVAGMLQTTPMVILEQFLSYGCKRLRKTIMMGTED